MKLAVYGTLRKNQGNDRCLSTSEYLGTTRIDGFQMVSLGGYPAVDRSKQGSITVEVYEASPEDVERCNWLEGYDPEHPEDSYYGRLTINTPFGEAEIYTMNGILEEDHYGIIESGDWTSRKR